LKDKKIGIIGTGNMGTCLISGLIYAKSSIPANIICSDVRKEKLKSIKDAYGVATTTNNADVVRASEIVVYAVKPQIMASVLRETASHLDMSKVIISIAAGVPLAAIESCLNRDLRLIRVMPTISLHPSRKPLRPLLQASMLPRRTLGSPRPSSIPWARASSSRRSSWMPSRA